MIALYTLLIQVYAFLIKLASPWNSKARLWIEGRKKVFEDLTDNIRADDRIIWFHCSSAGEFEQAKPVLERLKKEYPEHKILVSFFSPSGYKVGIGYPYADLISYLPVDTPRNARKWVAAVHPELVIFVKYEFWYHYLNTLKTKQVPTLLISATFRESQVFFKWYGSFYRKVLTFFETIFVQDGPSLNLVKRISWTNVVVAGDTRFDRVSVIAGQFTEVPGIGTFIQKQPVLIAGSTWEDDEEALMLVNNLKIILAPHEINEAHLSMIEKRFPDSQRYSRYLKNGVSGRVLIIDNVGMLSRLYQYATIAYIGGGFTRDGIHNILEAAVYGKPIIIGPVYGKYREAVELIERKAAYSIAEKSELPVRIELLLKDQENYTRAGKEAFAYVSEHKGATEKIVSYIQENRLLTR